MGWKTWGTHVCIAHEKNYRQLKIKEKNRRNMPPHWLIFKIINPTHAEIIYSLCCKHIFGSSLVLQVLCAVLRSYVMYRRRTVITVQRERKILHHIWLSKLGKLVFITFIHLWWVNKAMEVINCSQNPYIFDELTKLGGLLIVHKTHSSLMS